MDIVTVTFEDDVKLLELQMLSIAKYFNISDISNYIVIVNDNNYEEISERIKRFACLRLPQNLADLVVVKDASSYSFEGNGWRVQQYLKLLSVAACESDWVLVLDSKNFFVSPASEADFVIGGRAKSFLYKTPPRHRELLNISLKFFDVVGHADMAMPTITPYVMSPKVVADMLAEIKADPRIGGREDFFSAPALADATEFFCYYAYLLKICRLERLYTFGQRQGETLFTKSPKDNDVVNSHLRKAIGGQFLYFGLHRRRIPQLDDTQRYLLSQLLSRISGIDSPEYYLCD